MKTLLTPIALILLIGCSSVNEKSASTDKEQPAPIYLGQKINGDFDGDGELEEIEIVLIKEGFGNPQTDEDYEADQSEIRISNKKISSKGLSFDSSSQLINEGDLNGNGRDELSIVSYSYSGTAVFLVVYSYDGKSWSKILEPQIEPGQGTNLSLEDLQALVYKKNNKIHYLTSDLAGNTTEKQL
jgi:hypothetical protein